MTARPQGSALRSKAPASSATIDLTRSIPPTLPVLGGSLSRALEKIASDEGGEWLVRNAVPGGSPADRAYGASWIGPRFSEAPDPGRVLVTNGTQSALSLLLRTIVGNDGIVLAEALSYGVIRAVTQHFGCTIRGVPIDEEGLVPTALRALCEAERPKAIYCNPTVHNPTTAIMSVARREEIAGIARQYGVPIIEDDVLGLVHPDAPLSIASMAPDVTWYVSGTTKCLAHGLRIGHLVGPSSGEVERLFAAVNRLSYWFPSPLSAVILRNWIDNGSAQRIREAIIAESVARQQLAAGKLGNLGLVTRYGSFHGWLKLSPELDRHDFVRALANRGVRVREAELFAVEEGPVPNAIRISLSSADTIEDLAEGLDIIGDELMCGAEIERG